MSSLSNIEAVPPVIHFESFRLDYGQSKPRDAKSQLVAQVPSGTGDAKRQAIEILDKARELRKEEKGADSSSRKVGIIYSANYNQTSTIKSRYYRDEITTGISGSNQAEVMQELEVLLNDSYKDLARSFHIIPISTCRAAGGMGAVSDIILLRDICNLACHLGAGWHILGWQNQVTALNTIAPFAIGGGISRQLTHEQNLFIQDSLKYFQACSSLSPSQSLPFAGGKLFIQYHTQIEEALKLGQSTNDPLAYYKKTEVDEPKAAREGKGSMRLQGEVETQVAAGQDADYKYKLIFLMAFVLFLAMILSLGALWAPAAFGIGWVLAAPAWLPVLFGSLAGLLTILGIGSYKAGEKDRGYSNSPDVFLNKQVRTNPLQTTPPSSPPQVDVRLSGPGTPPDNASSSSPSPKASSDTGEGLGEN